MAGFFQMRERRALVVFLLLAGVFVAGLLLAERRKSAGSADRGGAGQEATGAGGVGNGSDGCGGLREAVRVRSQYGGVCRSAAAGTLVPHGGQPAEVPRSGQGVSDPRGCGYLLRHDRFGLFYSGTLYSDRTRVCADTFSASGISGVCPAGAEEDRAPRTIQDRYGVRILSRVARFFRPSGRGHCPLSGSLRRSSGRSGFSGLLYDR
ncbi:competence protein ComEA helix-hairpin-helix repeat region [Alistipes putredinis CAG:67]|nr:competence protein ComEA helix-hairpin-helix repeat region [Alistipes putredinis CAG:67]